MAYTPEQLAALQAALAYNPLSAPPPPPPPSGPAPKKTPISNVGPMLGTGASSILNQFQPVPSAPNPFPVVGNQTQTVEHNGVLVQEPLANPAKVGTTVPGWGLTLPVGDAPQTMTPEERYGPPNPKKETKGADFESPVFLSGKQGPDSGATFAAPGGAMPQFAGPSVLPGHEVRRVSPKVETMTEKALDKEEAAAQHRLEAQQGLIDAEKANAIDRANLMQQFANENRQRQEARKNILDQYQKDQTQMMSNIRDFKIDPSDAFGTGAAGAIRRVTAVVASALGGFAAGLRGGPNTVMQEIDHMVDQYVDAQKTELEKRKSLLQDSRNLYAQKLQQFGDEDVATAATKADTLASLEAFAQGQLADPRNNIAKADGEALLAAIGEKRAKVQDSMFGWQGPQMTGGDPRVKQIRELAEKLFLSKKQIAGPDGKLRPMTPDDANAIAFRMVTGAGPGQVGVVEPGSGKGGARMAGLITQMASVKHAIGVVDKEIRLAKDPSVGPMDRANESGQNIASLTETLPRAYSGTSSDAQFGLWGKALPSVQNTGHTLQLTDARINALNYIKRGLEDKNRELSQTIQDFNSGNYGGEGEADTGDSDLETAKPE